MLPDFQTCYRAHCARDARYDGRFFTAVTSTGIYCRPVCPAVAPKAANCRFFATAAAARAAGFRACLRCRPESAPHSPAWNGVQTTVARALRLIDEGALEGARVDDLARRLGIGSRYLRGLFAAHVGMSPAAVARDRRAARARELVAAGALPLADIAFAAGFGSVRAFNAAFRRCYGAPPSAFRGRGDGGIGDGGIGGDHANRDSNIGDLP